MKYDLSFTENTAPVTIVYHKESDRSIETQIVEPMLEHLRKEVTAAFPERSAEECLLALEYPKTGSVKFEFSRFFDSPDCVSFSRKSFKGFFIISVEDGFAHEQLIHFINKHASSEYRFIVLANCFMNTAGIRDKSSLKTVILQIDKRSLDKKAKAFYKTINKEKVLSLSEFRRAYETMLNGGTKQAINDCLRSDGKQERRIGF